MRHAAVVCLGAWLAASGCAAAASSTGGACDTSSSDALELRDYVGSLVTAPAADSALTRTRVGHRLFAGSAGDVAFVDDPQLCARAEKAYRAAAPAASYGRAIILLRAGSERWIAFDPHARDPRSEFGVAVVFDAHWRKLAAFTL